MLSGQQGRQSGNILGEIERNYKQAMGQSHAGGLQTFTLNFGFL